VGDSGYARTDLKNERISRSGGFQACYEIIRGVGGWSESRTESQYKVLLNPTPWEKCPIQAVVATRLAAASRQEQAPRRCSTAHGVAQNQDLPGAAQKQCHRWRALVSSEMRVVGLTGGIACGKSVCSSHVASIPGVAVVDCDLIARKVVEPGRSGLANIVDAFGAEVLQADGYARCHQLRTSQ
jgi:hypothetical protein